MVEIFFFFHLQEEIVQSPLSPKRKLYLLFFYLVCTHTLLVCFSLNRVEHTVYLFTEMLFRLVTKRSQSQVSYITVMNAAGAFPLLSAMSKQFYDVFHVGFLL